jgi:hypothetical protein
MTKFLTFPLEDRFSIGKTELLDVVIPMERSPFALIRYSIDGVRQSLGLRMDLDKRVLLDHLEDENSDRALTEAVPWLIEKIVTIRTGGKQSRLKR